MKGWLTLDEAAARVGRSKRTIYRWVQDGSLTIHVDRVIEEKLLKVDLAKRQRVGRPRAMKGMTR
ncbi:helix-turn-helix domain-containing protein [Cryobacterium fucosi]|uniref:helix-turn-helix transcriptional regulator n=1 Tax=Cryobacterium fucosi TaxID=1259157 RepID=UPI00141BF565